jgi:hypothetical protein
MTIQVAGFFCEDIREETNGQSSIVGILPDNVRPPPPPPGSPPNARLLMPRLGLYARLRIPLEGTLKPMPVSLIMANGERLHLGELGTDLIEKARRETRANNLPFSGLVFSAVLQGFQIAQPGVIVAVLESEGVEYQFAVLNLLEPTQASTNASLPPSSQSQPAA